MLHTAILSTQNDTSVQLGQLELLELQSSSLSQPLFVYFQLISSSLPRLIHHRLKYHQVLLGT